MKYREVYSCAKPSPFGKYVVTEREHLSHQKKPWRVDSEHLSTCSGDEFLVFDGRWTRAADPFFQECSILHNSAVRVQHRVKTKGTLVDHRK